MTAEYLGSSVVVFALSPTARKRRRRCGKVKKISEALVQNLGVGVYTTTLQGAFLQANPAFLRMTGYESVEEVLATPAHQFYADPDYRARFVAELLEHGRVSGFETTGREKDGDPLVGFRNFCLLRPRVKILEGIKP